MNSINLSIIALYGVSLVLIAIYLRSNDSKYSYVMSRITWLLAIGLHAYVLYMPLATAEGLRIDIVSASLQVLLLSNAVLYVTALTRQIDIVALLIIPLTIVMMMMGVFSQKYQSIQVSGALSLHILFAFLGYSLLFLATLQALILSLQSKLLRSHRPSGIIRSLPSLQAMESLLFRLIFMGVVLLSAGLLVGFIFLDDFFATERLHKTVLSIVAWSVYTILIIGHWGKGWRGNKAIKWAIAAFVILVLAFFGSKFVQDVVLNTAVAS